MGRSIWSIDRFGSLGWLELLLHPDRIEFLSAFLSDLSEPTALLEPVLLVKPYATGVEGRYAVQDVCNTFFSRALLKNTEQHLPQPFSSIMLRMDELCCLCSLRERRYRIMTAKHSKADDVAVFILNCP